MGLRIIRRCSTITGVTPTAARIGSMPPALMKEALLKE
jgi:hypothetical protein